MEINKKKVYKELVMEINKKLRKKALMPPHPLTNIKIITYENEP